MPEVISSEESEDEDIIIVKPLTWRSLKVTEMFRDLDEAGEINKSKQALRQRRKRIIGTVPSTRSMPDDLPKWAYFATYNKN